MEYYTYLRYVTDLLSDGKTPYERRFGQPFRGPIIPFGSLVVYHPITAKDQSRIHQFGKKVLPGLFLGYALYAGGNLEGWRTDRRPWGVGDDGRIGNLLQKTQCERGDISKTRRIYFPIADGRIKTPGGDQELRTSTLIRHRPIQGEGHVDFLGESEGSLPQLQDSFPDAGEAIHDFWYMSGRFIHRHHVEPRVKLYSPWEESHWWLLEHWWFSRLVWSLDRFHTIYSIGRKTSRRIYVVQGEINEETAYIQATSSMARDLEINGKACQSWRKCKSGLRKSSILKTHEDCVGSTSSTPRIRNSRKPSRTRVRNWKHQLLLLCPVKLCKIVGVVHPISFRQNLRVFWKLMESKRMCIGNSIPHHHEDHIARKSEKNITALQFGSQIYSYASSYENSGSESSGGQGMGKTVENFGVELDKSPK